MYKAITLIEMLITLAVMVIAIYFISPSLFHLQEPILLNNEIDQIKTFIYKVQTQARYQNKRYSVSINQNSTNYHWCMIALSKKSSKEKACDCLNLSSCDLTENYYLYYSNIDKIKLRSNNLYPNVFMNIDGVSGRLETICLGLIGKTAQQILQFDANGVINVAQKNKRTKCRE